MTEVIVKELENLDFANRITELMEERGLKIKELAYAAGLPYSTLFNILTGVSDNPSIKSLISISNFFDVSVDSLLGFKKEDSGEKYSMFRALTVPAGKVQKAPILTFREIRDWYNNSKQFLDKQSNYQWLYVERDIHKGAFFLFMDTRSLEPWFPKNSTLLVNPVSEYQADDYVVVSFDTLIPVIRLLVKEQEDLFFKGIIANSPLVRLEKQHKIFGKIVRYTIQTD